MVCVCVCVSARERLQQTIWERVIKKIALIDLQTNNMCGLTSHLPGMLVYSDVL